MGFSLSGGTLKEFVLCTACLLFDKIKVMAVVDAFLF
jgi:hypothetical protein